MLIRIKVLLFQVLDWLINSKSRNGMKVSRQYEGNKPIFWCFCSTVGELNACKTLIQLLPQEYQLVLFTDRDVYEKSYLKAFPQAIVVTLSGAVGENRRLVDMFPPTEVLICEIPLLLNDAPCRLSFELLYLAKRRGAKLSLVNGWLYGYSPSCRQDAIENKLFRKDYLDLFDLITVQSNSVKEQIELISGAKANLYVTGNMKFDALLDRSYTTKDHVSDLLLEKYRLKSDKVFVAGCLASFDDYELVIDAFEQIKGDDSATVMVFVPRHPENQTHMNYIAKLLDGKQWNVAYKSQLTEHDDIPDVLVLDTIGELKAYYSIASVCYVGTNHNVLEPLTFQKPTFVSGMWEQTYPSYPVYKVCLNDGLITQVTDASELAELIQSEVAAPDLTKVLFDAEERHADKNYRLMLDKGFCARGELATPNKH